MWTVGTYFFIQYKSKSTLYYTGIIFHSQFYLKFIKEAAGAVSGVQIPIFATPLGMPGPKQ
jgi:hypothetical protein